MLSLARLSQKSIHGYKIDCDLSEYIQRTVYFDQYEIEETRWVRELLKPGMTVVDAGANIGYYTLLAASLVGSHGRVFAFEPCHRIMKKLHRAVLRNNLHQVECFAAGLSDTLSVRRLYEPPGRYGNDDPSIWPYTSGMKTSLAKFTTLDAFTRTQNVARINLLKLDVEGAELRALTGGRGVLAAGTIHYIMCELNEALLRLAGACPMDVSRLIEGFGYVLADRTGTDSCYNALYRLQGQ